MENKINVAELLKDCPVGMELDCAIYENVTFALVSDDSHYPIKIGTPDGQVSLNRYGCYSNSKHAKCVIYPKGKTTWEGFVPPGKFKDGDIVAFDSKYGTHLFIFKEYIKCDIDFARCHVRVSPDGNIDLDDNGYYVERLATEEEKQKLFQAIKDNGYRWNEETKTLEKLAEPKFKDGDRVVKKGDISTPVSIVRVGDKYYYHYSNTEGTIGLLPIAEQDDWELVPNKFDIATLKPFDKVLVRGFGGVWGINLFGFYDGNQKEYPFYCIGQTSTGWNQCVPYEGNEHLLRTTNDCDDFYKTWE